MFENKDINAGLKAIGYDSMEDTEVKQFNKNALNQYNQIMDEQKNFCFNLFSDNEISNIQNKGKMDFLETASKHKFDELIPYWGSGKAGLQSISIHNKLNKLKNGDILSEHEKNDVRNYLRDMAECELRGRTLGSNVIEGLYSTAPFLLEAGIGFATTSEGVGLLSLGQTASKFSLRKGAEGFAKKEIRKALEKQAKQVAIDNAKKLAYDSTVGTAKFTVTKTPTEWLKSTGDYLISDDLAISERGQYILSEGKSNPAKAIMLGLGDTMIENFSETSGVLFGMAGKALGKAPATKVLSKYIDKNILNKLPSKFTNGFKDLVEKTTNLPFAKALQQYGYHGIIEEMGEERIGDFLRFVCDMDGEKGYSFEQLARALFPSKEQLATEAILFGLMGGGTAAGLHGLKKGINYSQYKNVANDIRKQSLNKDGSLNFDKMQNLIKENNPDISDKNLNNIISSITNGISKVENYSVDDFLVDSGIFKTPHRESITNSRVRNALSKSNLSEENIETILNFANDTEKANLINSFNTLPEEQYSKAVDSVTESLLQSGKFTDKEQAEKVARLGVSMLSNISEKTGISAEDLINEDMAEIEQIDREEFVDSDNVLQGSVVYNHNVPSIGEYLDKLVEDYNNLPADYDNTEDIERRMAEMDILGKIASGEELSLEDTEKVNDLIADYEAKGNEQFADVVRATLDNLQKSNNNIEKHFGDTAQNITQNIKSNILNILEENGLDKSEFNFEDVRIYGSYSTGSNKETSDLDVIVQYSGSMREDDAFNMLNDEKLTIEDVNGRTVEIDINPINVEQSGTVDENLKYFEGLEPKSQRYNQAAMYKSPKKDFAEFYKQVFEKENQAKKNNSKIAKSFYDYSTKDVSVRVPHDTVVHDNNKHNLTVEEWKDVLQNLNKPVDAVLSNKPRFNGQPVLLKIVSNKNTYGTVVEFFDNKQPIITTAFKDTEKNIDNWLKNEAIPSGTKTTSDISLNQETSRTRNTSAVTTKGMLPSSDSVNIINYVKTNLNPNVNKHEGKAYYQSAYHGTPQGGNNIVDLTNDFEKAPTIDEVKNYINEIIKNGTKFATLSPEWFIDVKGGNRVKKKLRNDGNYKKLDKKENIRHNKYIMSLQKLLSNAEYAGEKENTKKDKKPNVAKYHYFKTNVKIGNKIYEIVFDTEEYNNENPPTAQHAKRALKPLSKDNIIITDNAENINPKTVHLYNITEIKQPKTYYQERQNKLFIDNEKAEEIADRLTKVKGSFIPAENLIRLFKDADESTIVHEFAHWWLEKLVKYSAESEELQEDLKEIRKFVKNHGEPFTTEQHERFARGFEAYIRTGSAKTNRLKKLFEDFKNALLSLYDSIKSLGFDENEIPEINNLFDRLLTTENQRIQAVVFDRCNNIQAQILEIRNNQEKELAEIDEIYKSNIERNLKDTRKQKQVEEYLRLADKATSRVPKAVKEYQSRYRNATFEILEKATGYKRQFIANPKNWEKVQDKIENMADPFSSTDGMQASWREFYADSGVSYDNMETDGDYNLAYQAFDVLQSDNYLPQETFEGEEKIGKFFGTFDYLAGKVMSLRGENKDAAFEALTSIFDNIPAMPDAAMQEIHDKLGEISNTFIEQKSNERSKGLRNVSLTSQLRTFVSHKMHEMKAYDPETKRHIRLSEVNKLYSLLKYATDVQSTKEIIRTINAHAIKQLENRQKHILHKEIQKQVKINSKLIKVGALKRGKFDWKTNTVFADLQQMNRLSQEDAKKEYLKLINADNAILGEERVSIEDNPSNKLEAPTDFQKTLKVKFLEYKGNKTNDLNLSATRTLLEDILELKFEGRRAKNEEELKKALSRYDYQTDLVSIINANANNKSAQFIARLVAGDLPLTSEGTLANWESLLTSIFNRETAKKYSLLKTESDVEVFAHRKCLEFYNKALDIYGLRRSNDGAVNKAKNLWDRALDFDNIQPLVKLFNEYEDEVYTFKQITFNKDTEKFVKTNVEISHAQLITLYAWSLNPELKKRLITQFVDEDNEDGEQLLNDIMFSKLSDQDKQFAWAMVDICDSMYEDTNEVFIRTTGLSLPRVDNYIPSKTERIGSDLDMMHENMLRSTNPSFIKQRKNCGRIKMDPQSPLAIILPHINKTARYIVMSEKVNFYNRIFQAPDVKAALIESYGKKSGTKIHQVLLNQLATSTYENYARSITVGKNLIDTVASNYITSKIGGNLKVMFSQLTSVINYAENMPTHLWATEFTKALANPKETISFMFDNCEYLQARLAGNSQNEIISTLTNESDKFRSLRNWCTSNTKYGDILAIMFGGKPYVDYLMKNGMTKDEAFEKFVEDTLRSQQSGHNSATSAWQKKQAQNAFTRMVFAFNNTNLQYERKFIDAVSNYVKGDISKQEFLKAFAIYKVFNPILFTSFLTNLSLSSLIMGLAGGDDDALLNFGGDIFTAIICSNLKAYGFLGIIANAITSAIAAKMTGGRYFPDTLPLISDFESSMQKLLNSKKLEFSDYIEMLIGAGDYATGVAVTRLYNAAGGIGDIAEGEIGTGLLRLIGYGKYRATVGATGRPPIRNK